MKWLTTILSVYLLGLALWPCADEPLYITGQAAPLVVSLLTGESDGPHHHEHDACTPFCTCACCAATITVIPRFIYSLTSSVEIIPMDVVSFHYVSAHLADPLSAIWQPPKRRV